MPGRGDPGSAVDAEAHVALPGGGGLAGVDAHPDPQLRALRPFVLGETPLCLDGCRHRFLRPPKGDEERISLCVDLVPELRCKRVAQDPLMLLQRLAVALAQLLQQPSRALDVGEQEGDGADRELVDRAHWLVVPPFAGVS